MNTNELPITGRQATMNGLAIVGLIALVAAGIYLAIYATRFAPIVVDRIGSAAVYLGSIFTPSSPDSGLTVVSTPAASTTLSFGNSTTTPAATPTDTKPAAPAGTKYPAPTTIVAGGETRTTYANNSPEPTFAPYGLSDLTVSISQIGHMTTESTDSFSGSSNVPAGRIPAVKFTISNIGTNWSGTWRFSVVVPTSPAYTFTSDVQNSLAPGDHIDYTLGFNHARKGEGTITITANSDNSAVESTASNNALSTQITIE